MMDKPKMTMTDLICYLRQDLIEAREQKNQDRIQKLFGVFGILEEAAEAIYTKCDGQIIGIFTELECSARDSLDGVEWKSNIPSVEEIAAATH